MEKDKKWFKVQIDMFGTKEEIEEFILKTFPQLNFTLKKIED